MPNIPISPLDRDSGYFSFDLDAIPGGNPANAFPDRPRGSLTSVSDSYESTASSEATSPYEFQNLRKGSALKTPASALLVENDIRVILKMEVDHREHSFLIGVRGDKVNEMRSSCSCHIHYPDSKENGRDAGKLGEQTSVMVNEVIVRGKIHNVILGAQKVREAVPFNFIYNLPQNHYFRRSVLDHQLVDEITRTSTIFGIEANYAPKENGEMQVFIRGPQSSRTLVGVRAICTIFSAGLPQDDYQISQLMCVHPNSQSSMWVFCDGERWLKMLSRVTGVRIAFPNPRGNNGDRQTVSITGSVNGVAAAFIVLMSMMPVTLRLNIPSNMDEVSLRVLYEHITKDLHVNFLAPRSVPSTDGQQQYIELKSYEGNLDNICRAYRRIVGNCIQVSKFKVVTTAESLVKLSLHTVLPGILHVVSDPATSGRQNAVNPTLFNLPHPNAGWYPPGYFSPSVTSSASAYPQLNSPYALPPSTAVTPESIRVAAQLLHMAQSQETERRKLRKKERALRLRNAALLFAQTMDAKTRPEDQSPCSNWSSQSQSQQMSYDDYLKAQLISKKVVAVNAWETTFTGYSPSPQRMKGETGEEEAQLWQQYPNQNYLDDLNNLVQSSAPSTPLTSNGAAFSFDFMDAWRKTQASYPQ